MKKQTSRFFGNLAALWVCCMALSPLVQGAEQGKSFLVNGDFKAVSAQSGLPEGWDRKEVEGKISREEENGVTFLRLVSEAPDQLVLITQDVQIPAGVKGVEFTARFRTANVKFGKNFLCDARARFGFYDASGTKVGKDSGDVIFQSQAKDWTDKGKKFLVPEGAATLRVNLCLNRPASGTLDVEKVSLTAMDAAEAEAMIQAPMLAEKQKLADEEEAAKMLLLPAKTRELKVSGNKLVTEDGKRVLLQGVNVVSLEWSPKGEQVFRSVKIALQDWKANAIRLPVHNDFWFGRGKGDKVPPNDAEAYRKIVDDVIKMAAGQGAYVIFDLHLFGGPKEDAVEFWKDAAARYANHPAVLFDIFNEPTGITWELWRYGGDREVKDKKTGAVEVVKVVGMQALVDAVRSTGAKNIIVAGGIDYANKLGGVLEGFALNEPGGNGIMYATHFYNWHKNWEKTFLALADKYPILVGEFGADVNKMSFIPAKNQEDPYTWVPDALGMVQKYELNWTAFSFHPKATPVLIKDWTYEPTPFWGAFVKDALGGKKFEMQKLR